MAIIQFAEHIPGMALRAKQMSHLGKVYNLTLVAIFPRILPTESLREVGILVVLHVEIGGQLKPRSPLQNSDVNARLVHLNDVFDFSRVRLRIAPVIVMHGNKHPWIESLGDAETIVS